MDELILISNLPESEYQRELQRLRQEFKETVERNFPGKWRDIELCSSVYSLLYIRDVSLPLAVFLLGNPSSKKSTALHIFSKLNRTYKSDSFTPKSFVSHSASVKREELKEIDLLPRIKNRCFITPELAPIFGAPKEVLLENFAIMTRILDGQGYTSDSGVHGKRGYEEPISFMWLGGVVDIPHIAWKLMGHLGSRLYFLRVQSSDRSEDEAVKDLLGPEYMKKLLECQEACERYFKWLNGRNYPIDWQKTDEPEEVLRIIVKLARLLSRLRAVVQVRETKDTAGGSNYAFGSPVIESPDRAESQLYNLARGHAYSCGRKNINYEDLPLVIEVTLSSAPKERVCLLNLLLNGEVTTKQLEEALGCSKQTALKTMKELSIIGLVDESEEDDTKTKPQKVVRLKYDFKWFLSDDFKAVRVGSFTPKILEYSETDNSEDNSKELAVSVQSPEEDNSKYSR